MHYFREGCVNVTLTAMGTSNLTFDVLMNALMTETNATCMTETLTIQQHCTSEYSLSTIVYSVIMYQLPYLMFHVLLLIIKEPFTSRQVNIVVLSNFLFSDFPDKIHIGDIRFIDHTKVRVFFYLECIYRSILLLIKI